MKKIFVIVILLINCQNSYCQEITGTWKGLIEVQAIKLRVVFNISKTGEVYSSTMDSPDQGVKGIPVTSTSFENSTLELVILNAGIKFVGFLERNDVIIGTFNQWGQSFPITLSKKLATKEEPIRSQEPTKPYPYYSEEITFENTKAEITLSGTLTLPSKNGIFPVVVLISGSGPQNRDEEIFGHKPFLVLADHLTKNGIGVLRFDDRGTAKSTGNFKTSTTLDFSTDVEASIKYLLSRKEINKKKIGLIGHSEGGIIASMVASKSKNISYIVMLAGSGLQGNQLLLLQQELIGKASGISEINLQLTKNINSNTFNIVIKSENSKQLKIDLAEYIKQSLKYNPTFKNSKEIDKENFIKSQVNIISSPWMQYFIKYNPAIDLEKVDCPVLAINGEKDLQVPPKENLKAIKKALIMGGNKKITIKELPNLNHLFQQCKTGLPSEYATIEQTISPIALSDITTWILNQVK
jgi:pimeloyl-ACP methyl ester carboxylesterase